MRTVVFAKVRAVGENATSVKVEIEGTDYWVPKFQLGKDSQVKESCDEGDLIVNALWAKKVGLPTEPKKEVDVEQEN